MIIRGLSVMTDYLFECLHVFTWAGKVFSLTTICPDL